jgi:hypothetical protein
VKFVFFFIKACLCIFLHICAYFSAFLAKKRAYICAYFLHFLVHIIRALIITTNCSTSFNPRAEKIYQSISQLLLKTFCMYDGIVATEMDSYIVSKRCRYLSVTIGQYRTFPIRRKFVQLRAFRENHSFMM